MGWLIAAVNNLAARTDARLAFELLSFSSMTKNMFRVKSNKWRPLIIGGLSLLFMGLSVELGVNAQTVKKNPDNRELLSIMAQRLVSAWNKQDSEMIVGLFLPDAVLVMPTGKIARTRSGIRERLIDEWNGKLKDTTLSHAVEAVSLESNATAMVKGKYRLEGVKVLGFEKAPEGSFVFNHKKAQGRWMIAKAELHGNQAEQTST